MAKSGKNSGSDRDAEADKGTRPEKGQKSEKATRFDRSSTLNRLQSSARLSRTALAARLQRHGFYAGQEQIMLALAGDDGMTPGQLASRLGVRPPTITKAINRLQTQGFLSKAASTEDARQSHISLTQSGREAILSIEKSIRKTQKLALKGFDKKDQKTLVKLLQRIEANLGAAVIEDIADDVVDLDEERAVRIAEIG